MNKKMYTKKQIVEKLNEKYGNNNVCIVSTEGYDLTTYPTWGNNKKERCMWADVVVRKLYNGKNRIEIKKKSRNWSTGEYSFSYVKFACDNDDNIYGIVSGSSSFHEQYASDVYFYDIYQDEFKNKEAVKRMKEKKLKWYKKEILILKNINVLDRKEASKREKEIKKLFELSD